MAIGQYFWVGVRDDKDYVDDDCLVRDTISPTRALCVQRIMEQGFAGKAEPVRKLLILRGRMTS